MSDEEAIATIEQLLEQGRVLFGQRRFNAALARITEALDRARETLPVSDSLYGACVLNAADVYMALESYDTAEHLVLEYMAQPKQAGSERNDLEHHFRNLLANLYVRTDRPDLAERIVKESIALIRSSAGDYALQLLPEYHLLLMIHRTDSDIEAAREALAAMAAIHKRLPPGHPRGPDVEGTMASARRLMADLERSQTLRAAGIATPLERDAFDDAERECWQLFVSRDFGRAAYRSLELLVQRASLRLLEIRLISLRWLARSFDRDRDKAFKILPTGIWGRSLVEFTVGLDSYERALEVANAEDGQCFVAFYAGMLAVADRDERRARERFGRAAAFSGDLPEKRQAAVELEALDLLARDAGAFDEEQQRSLESAYHAFASYDYAAFLGASNDLIARGVATPQLMLQYLGALRAFAQQGLITSMLPHARRRLTLFPWHVRLIDVVIGDDPPQTILAKAQNDVERCQANYFTAVRMELAGRWQEADAFRRGASDSPAECTERQLARLRVDDFARVLRNLANRASFLHSSGQIDASEMVARRAADLAQQSNDLTQLVRARTNLAAILVDAGHFGEASDLFNESLSAVSQLPDDVAVALLLGAAQLHEQISAMRVAHDLITRALTFEKYLAARPDVAASITNTLGQVQMASGQLVESVATFDQAARLMDTAREKRSYERVAIEDNAGVALVAGGHYPEALARFERARAIVETLHDATKSDGITHPSELRNLVNLSHTLLAVGRLEEAERRCREALDAAAASQRNGTPTPIGWAEFTLGLILTVQGRPAEAMDRFLAAARSTDGVLGEMMAVGSDELRMGYVGTALIEVSALVTLTANHFHDDASQVERALDIVLRRRALAGEAFAMQQEAIRSGRYVQLRPMLDALNAQRASLAAAMLSRSSDASNRSDAVTSLRFHLRELEARLARSVPDLHLETYLGGISARRVAAGLPADWTIVEFVRAPSFEFRPAASHKGHVGPEHYWAFVVPVGDFSGLRLADLGPASVIDDLIDQYRRALAGYGAGRDLGESVQRQRSNTADSVGLSLRRVLFDPLQKWLPPTRHIVIAQDAALAHLPFGPLPFDDDGRLMNRYTFSYVTTARDLLRGITSGTATPSIVAADPDFDLSVDVNAASSGPFRELRGTKREGEHVAGLLGIAPWTGPAVLKSRVKEVSSPLILHIATHGFFAEDNPAPSDAASSHFATRMATPLPLDTGGDPLLRSGLAMAGANTWLAGRAVPGETEGGLLTAAEVLGMNLYGTELVVLSACDTGLGQLRASEGVIGLRRAFLLAGAKTVVVSLWKVPDDQTAELMEGFYRRLLRGMPRADALSAAQMQLSAKYPTPFHWGAFICVGAAHSLGRQPLATTGASVFKRTTSRGRTSGGDTRNGVGAGEGDG